MVTFKSTPDNISLWMFSRASEPYIKVSYLTQPHNTTKTTIFQHSPIPHSECRYNNVFAYKDGICRADKVNLMYSLYFLNQLLLMYLDAISWITPADGKELSDTVWPRYHLLFAAKHSRQDPKCLFNSNCKYWNNNMMSRPEGLLAGNPLLFRSYMFRGEFSKSIPMFLNSLHRVVTSKNKIPEIFSLEPLKIRKVSSFQI